MHADSENCQIIRYARTLQSDRDETTNLPATPGIPHICRHLVLKGFDFALLFLHFDFSIRPSMSGPWVIGFLADVPPTASVTAFCSVDRYCYECPISRTILPGLRGAPASMPCAFRASESGRIVPTRAVILPASNNVVSVCRRAVVTSA